MAGFLLGLVLFLLGFILPPSDGIGLVVDASVFHESFLAGGIGKSFKHILHLLTPCLEFEILCG
uniref:Putative zinc metalloprotease EGY2ic isoform X3 n=1 Tax=Rhizophora mucronata TaxID=61149 RepID=A0A2P2LQ51_RHIMU